MPELVYDVKFRIDTSNVETVKSQMQQATSAPTAGGTAGFSASETAAKGLTKELKNLRTETLTTAQEVGTLVNKLATASNGFTRFNDETERLEAELKELVSGGLQPGISAFENLTSKTELSATGQLNAERTVKSLTGSVRTAEGALRRYADAQNKATKSTSISTNANQSNTKSVSNLVNASTLQQGKLKDLSIQMVALTNSGEGTEQQFEQLRGEFAKQLEAVNRYIKLLRNASKAEGLSIAQKKRLQATINSLSQTSVRANSAMGAMNQQNLAVGHSSQLANKQLAIGNQLFFSMSDGIQDAAQFSQGFSVGMRAVGNNIGFTAELMAAFIARTAAMNGGIVTTTAVLNSLKASFLGVGGVILALNTAITLLTVFSQKSSKAAEEANRLAEVMRELRGIGDLDFGIAAGLESEEQALTRIIDQLNDLEEAQRRAEELNSLTAIYGRDALPNLKAQEQAINEQREAVMLVAESYGFEEKSLKELEKRLDQVTKARELFTGGTTDATIALGGFVDVLNGQAQQALLRQELGLDGSNEEVERQRRVLQELIQEWTAVVNAGDNTLVPFLAQLKRTYDDLAPDEEQAATPVDPEKAGKDFDKLLTIFRLRRLEPTREGLLEIERLELEMLQNTAQSRGEYLYEAEQIRARTNDELIKLEEQVTDRQRRELNARNELRLLDIERQYDGITEVEMIEEEKLRQLRQSAAYALMTTSEKELAEQQIIQESENQKTRIRQQSANAQMAIDRQVEAQKLATLQTAVSGFSALAQAGFQNDKDLAIAVTIVETIVAAQIAYKKALAASALTGGVGTGAAAAAAASVVASGMARVMAIKNTEIGGGSVPSTSSASSGSFGFQMNEVEGAQTFRTPGFIPENGMMGKETPVKVEILADGKQLYSVVKRGEEQYRQRSV